MSEFKLKIRKGSRVHTYHGLFISRCSGFPPPHPSALLPFTQHTALLSHKSLISANEKHIAESDLIAGHDSSSSQYLPWAPCCCRGLLLVPSHRRRRGGDGGCGSGYYTWEDEIIMVSMNSERRERGKYHHHLEPCEIWN